MFLMVYHSQVYKEISLSGLNDMDCEIHLNAGEFELRRNLTIRLDVTGECWRLFAAPGYRLRQDGRELNSALLRDGELIHLITDLREQLHLIAVDGGNRLPVTDKINLGCFSTLTFGSGEENNIRYSFQELVSRRHGGIERRQDGFYLLDTSTNGTYCNGRKVHGAMRLRFGDCIQVFGLCMVFMGSVVCVGTRTGGHLLYRPDGATVVRRTAWNVVAPPPAVKQGKIYFSRSPRNIPELFSGEKNIDPAPGLRTGRRKPLLLTIGPSLTMALPMLLGCLLAIYGSRKNGSGGGTFMYTGLITALGSAVIGAMWALLNLRQARKEEREEEDQRFEAYSGYLTNINKELGHYYQSNREALARRYPPPSYECTYTAATPQLWERNQSHEDFLFCRLGLGDRPFPVEINIPKENFEMQHDSLRERPRQIKQNYSLMHQVPVGVDLSQTTLLGIVGGQNLSGAIPVLYALLAGIAVNNCYTEVKIAFVGAIDDASHRQQWEFLKWLPHLWNERRTTCYLALTSQERGDVFYELLEVLRRRSQEAEGYSTSRQILPRPFYVLVVENAALLEGELIAGYLLKKTPGLGIATVFLAERAQDLPNECENIVQNDGSFQGIYNTVAGNRQQVAFDTVTAPQLEKLAHTLTNVRVRETEHNTDIPQQLDFLEMYGVRELRELNVEDRWRKSRTYNTLRVPIGQKAGGELCCLDVHEKFHGPHGLVAGTTGSGKSETLQTYILSLAVQFSPDDVGFFIIDFKGGGMANLFEGLPHMLGQISNLSGNQVHRAMISIKSENQRRQRIFNEHGVNNINLYTRLYKNGESKEPVPHLFIIIDEFAELKREQPDFMRELISVAQVGRSLGVHLILATQKPSGTVDDNIWSNAKFRLCLRVQDRQDSMDMLHRPDAAFITNAGRGFLQVGNDEIYEAFQSAWSGAPYEEDAGEGQAAAAVLLTRTGKVGVAGGRTKRKRLARRQQRWLEELATEILRLTREDVAAMEEARQDKLREALFDGPFLRGADYARSPANTAALTNFLRQWPADCRDPARVAEAAMGSGLVMPLPKEKTQLSALVEYLAAEAKAAGYRPGTQLWMPVLPQRLGIDQLPGYQSAHFEKTWPSLPQEWELRAEIGLLDDPEHQVQPSLWVDFWENGHLAVLGAVVSGKSVLLQTLVYSLVVRYPPDRLNLYLMDFSSHMLAPFAEAPHVGAVLYENDLEQVGKLMKLIQTMMNERKERFSGGNYSQYVRAYGLQLPAVAVVLDNYAAFAEKTGGQYEETILRLAREGVSYGMYLILSAAGFGINELPNRIGDNLRTVISLDLGDKFKFIEAMRTTRLPVLPESGVPGRGLATAEVGVLEFQTALAQTEGDDYARGQFLTSTCAAMRAAWTGRAARRVPTIPETPVFSLLRQHDAYAEASRQPRLLPFAYGQEDASLYSLDLGCLYCYSVLGRARTGKTNTLKVLLSSAAEKKGTLVIFEKGAARFAAQAAALGAEYLQNDAELFAFWKRMSPVFAARNKKKRALLEQGMTEQELYEAMQSEPPIFIFIADLQIYLRAVYKPEGCNAEMSGFMETIFAKGALHNIYFFAAYTPEEMGAMNAYPAFRSFTASKAGVLLGGNVSGQRLFTFQNIPFAEMSKTVKRGVGLTPDGEDDTQARRIVIPLAER